MYKIKKVMLSAKTDYFRFFLDPRIMTVGILLIFIYSFVIKELLNCAEKTGIPLNAAEAFIAVGNSGLLIMFIPSVFMILASDFPNMGKHLTFVVIRTGRLPWLFGKILSAVMCIVTYLGGIFVFCMLAALQNGVFSPKWSDTVTKYISMFPEEQNPLISSFLPSNLYHQMSLGEALFHTIALLALYLFLLCLIILFFRILGMRTAGIAAAFTVIACGTVTSSIKTGSMWLFPMAHTIPWLHYEEAIRKPILPLWVSYVYFIVLIIICITANIIAAKKSNYYTMEED